MTFDAVLLASFGGPEGADEVMPFLERVTAGRDVSASRLEDVAEHYYALGGVSPIQEQNRQLRAHLQAEIERRGLRLPVYWGNRNSTPFFEDALRGIHRDGHHKVLAIATSAYSSYSGCRQYRENLWAALMSSGLSEDLTVLKVKPFFERSGFTSPFAHGIAEALRALTEDGIDTTRIRVLFTTHSIPVSMALASGPDVERSVELPGLYERQHLHVAQTAMTAATAGSAFHDVQWSLVFQSRSGPSQVPWLEPDIDEGVHRAAADGALAVVVVPIGFISDHVEVVWDLDRVTYATAVELGLRMIRVPTPGVSPVFVSALVDLIEAATETSPARPDEICSVTCCVNARGELPAVAAAR